MKYVIIILILGLSLFSIGQETKKIKNKISSYEKESYYVLKTNKDIKHGPYELYHNKWLKLSGNYLKDLKSGRWVKYSFKGAIIWEGSYEDDLKEGWWITYSENEKIETKGQYKANKRIGVWEFYNNMGLIVQQFDFKKNKLIFMDSTNLTSQSSICNGIYDGLIYIDTLPTYKNGEAEFYKFIANNLQYPEEELENNINGRVFISVFVNSKGELSDFKVYKGIGKDCDSEAIRVLKLTNGNWNAAWFNDRHVGTRMIVPFKFKLI